MSAVSAAEAPAEIDVTARMYAAHHNKHIKCAEILPGLEPFRMRVLFLIIVSVVGIVARQQRRERGRLPDFDL